ncbi:hypothetical protein CWI38_1596p0020 [Hamiltosporidium tvaerminnensis]|uniref:Uncharacterized protein n=2 Tax=Hamiltosporidium TaxID=1176354 RepID=A0A4Q9L9U3_9MICR|nr:hypothetical protein LUQ84_002620 [Hamiltosporidium tvaerminnensis]TBU03906.1 hypothetical protein CWI37_0213p0050 [Hamiltosporidium tvaerminnensis]TBU04434.1 hypothetical protein CWI36_0763p0030 [Hamiltosporidium magnivora]TBU09854.1 hypothetical protein CWI39_0029p0050 [Hamiltosporidium magnivora]TBU10707.1 hypothetical protein CWI38_1596p0020 [Hamiltosporidium tvaerminnensis]
MEEMLSVLLFMFGIEGFLIYNYGSGLYLGVEKNIVIGVPLPLAESFDIEYTKDMPEYLSVYITSLKMELAVTPGHQRIAIAMPYSYDDFQIVLDEINMYRILHNGMCLTFTAGIFSREVCEDDDFQLFEFEDSSTSISGSEIY